MICSYVRINPADLRLLKERLFDEGFYDPWFAQEWKDHQVFGLAKELSSPFEWHIRAFRDGRLESEIEISRRYIGHQSMPARPFHDSLIAILRKHRIQFEFTDALPPDPEEMSAPSNLVDWLPLAAFFFNPVLRLCRAFKEKDDGVSPEKVEGALQINLQGLVLASLILSVPLRIVANILLMIPIRARFNIFSGLRRLALIRPPQQTFILSLSTLKIEDEQKMFFQRFIDNLKLNKLAEL